MSASQRDPSHVRKTRVALLFGRLEPQSAPIIGTPTFRPSALAVTGSPVVTSLATRKRGAVSATVVRRAPDRDTLRQPLVSPGQKLHSAVVTGGVPLSMKV